MSKIKSHIWNQSAVRRIVAPHHHETPEGCKGPGNIRARLIPALQLLSGLGGGGRKTLDWIVVLACSVGDSETWCCFCVLRLL